MNCHLLPNWTESVSETYEFRTTIFTSRSGREQRMAERLLPRRTVTFSSLHWNESLQAFQAMLHNRDTDAIRIPDPARYVAVLDAAAPAGSTSIVLTSSPAWLKSGMALVLSSGATSEFANGGSIVVVGNFDVDFSEDFDGQHRVRITLAAPLSQSWPAGTIVRPVIEGRLRNEQRLEFRNDSIATTPISFTILPPSQVPDLGPSQFPVFMGRPVFLTPPNWTQPPSVTYDTKLEEIDYGRGVTRPYLPVDFQTRISQFSYLGRTRDTIAHILNLFIQMRGRQGEFWCPTWTTDMIPTSGISSGASVLTVAGSTIQQYNASPVNKVLAILLTDGRWIFREVASIAVSATSGAAAFDADFSEDFDSSTVGNFSLLTFTDPINEDIYRGDIAMICWLNLSRFAIDTLSVRWSTDDTAQVVCQIMGLEVLPTE